MSKPKYRIVIDPDMKIISSIEEQPDTELTFPENPLHIYTRHISTKEHSHIKKEIIGRYQKLNIVNQLEYSIVDRIKSVFSPQETSLERIERKLDKLRTEVATKDDLLRQTNELLVNQKQLNLELKDKIDILRDIQYSNIAYKRLARYSTSFLLFFTFTYLVDVLVGTSIIDPFWNSIGLILSSGFLFMAAAMRFDWNKYVVKKNDGNNT